MLGQKQVFVTQEFPLVSVIVPAYNAQQYIGATLQSIIRQSYPHLEIIFTDDGSSDRTVEIVKEAMIKDQRIRLLQ
jgi:glycosyltransferase involved in cell wall biosynthesis